MGEQEEKWALLEDLHSRYAAKGWKQRLVYYRKKYSWAFVVKSTELFKRIVDVLVAFLALVAFSPVFLLISACIRLGDGGPVFYVSRRVGKWGKEFSFPKFRSMKVGADLERAALLTKNAHKEGVTFKMKSDPRVTRVGRFLRKTSLDELPQLWSVLKGDMSLVGPRPPLPEEVEGYTLNDRKRLDTKPGMTCIWQVSGRAELSFSKQVKLDLEYIESQSFWLDLKLLLKTIPAVLLGRGAH